MVARECAWSGRVPAPGLQARPRGSAPRRRIRRRLIRRIAKPDGCVSLAAGARAIIVLSGTPVGQYAVGSVAYLSRMLDEEAGLGVLV
jgi:hypothetical protein